MNEMVAAMCVLMEWGLLSDYNTERWTIEGNMFGDCHVPCTPKPFYVDFRKEYAHCSHHFIHFCSFDSAGSLK
jgi:hypothetical protein